MPYHWEQNHGKSKAGMLKGSPFQHNYHLDGPVPNLDQSVSGKCSKNSSTKFRGCGPQGFKVSKDSAGTPVGRNVFHNGVVKKIATKARCSGKMFQDCCKMVVW